MHPRLILLRHGQSAWNALDLFTGWVDIPLSPKGIEESLEAGRQIAQFPIDLIYTSTLLRAQMTGFLAMSVHASGRVPYLVPGTPSPATTIFSEKAKAASIPVFASPALNERCYGKLQGMNKQEMRAQYGEAQVQIWRRSYDGAPPEGESLAMTAARTLPYFDGVILPQLRAGKNLLIAAHGNSLRSIVMELDGLSKEEVVNLEIPTGIPLIYRQGKGEQWSRESL